MDRDRPIWELLARLCLEHASEVWWTGWKAACKNLEKIQGTLAGNWWVEVLVVLTPGIVWGRGIFWWAVTPVFHSCTFPLLLT